MVAAQKLHELNARFGLRLVFGIKVREFNDVKEREAKFSHAPLAEVNDFLPGLLH